MTRNDDRIFSDKDHFIRSEIRELVKARNQTEGGRGMIRFVTEAEFQKRISFGLPIDKCRIVNSRGIVIR